MTEEAVGTVPGFPPALPPLREVIARHGLEARKALGQHFLLDPHLMARIVREAGPMQGRTAIEIGPGPGGLTRALLETAVERVVAIELDHRAIPALEELAGFYPDRLTVLEADAMRVDLGTLTTAPRRIVANLPYNVGTPLLVGWLRQAALFESMTLMFQQEVAERICAAPGSDAYGRLGVLAQWTCRVDMLMSVPPGAFHPPPKVYSSVAALWPREAQPSPALFTAMERVTAAAFGQRRKMLRGALKSLGGEALLSRAGIAGDRRAETLTIEEFDRLARTSLGGDQ
ncbi:16S rRNA (adenine(1518)-N(6)/adenine(1519)-N(6))-dimethyltransferase RsmA [Granulibacter bethesdensis]|nr:16S rRNA (adenine(1518)-N(6)/adenine(1519)-N(6))-dimethyltransferase RsmA [Granulibacter bethesdensis]